MVGGGIRIGRVFGIPIYLHSSWFIVFALITFSLVRQFNSQHPQWSESQHWMVGVLTSLLFFGSVLFHELSHSVVARHFRIPVVSITLFVFGGVARIGRDAPTPRQEFLIAAAGPLSSYLLSGGFYLLGRGFPESSMVGALAGWLMMINFALATFNLIPGFPMDGGRILRSIAWGITGNFSRATKVASRGGQIFAYLFILLGVWQALSGEIFDGLWIAFIGWFLLTAAGESYAQVAMRDQLQGLRAENVMSTDLPLMSRSDSLEDYLRELLRTGRRCHLVTGNGQLVGMITVHELSKHPREEWANTSVQAAMLPREKIHWTTPEAPVLGILEQMQSEDINQMPVVSGEAVVGMVARDDILRMIQARMEFGGLVEKPSS
jgi:Zn-dependent protease/predicted transcriptional regulator